jgi:hypothetical protein
VVHQDGIDEATLIRPGTSGFETFVDGGEGQGIEVFYNLYLWDLENAMAAKHVSRLLLAENKRFFLFEGDIGSRKAHIICSCGTWENAMAAKHVGPRF